uniref:Uncharacterized protein n=1 Tax=Leersia perrieri TaxID=77586 RepID=A0A0D9XDL8_9ORYZ
METAVAAGGAATSSGGGGSPSERRGVPVTWRRVWRAAQEAAAHALLLCFTALLSLKLDALFRGSWWVIFTPLWLFHVVIARCRFSLPAPSSPQGFQMASCHSIVATPLLLAFELLLCVYLEGHGESFIDLKLVFLPLLALEIITLVDNFRMCGSLMPGHGETMTDEAIWERLPDIGGPILIIPIVIFQVLLCMRLEGTPSNARFFPLRAVFLPILLLQLTAVCFAIWIFFKRLVTKLRDKNISNGYISLSSKIDELFMMMQHGSRLIAWWSIDEDSNEEQAHLFYANNTGYSTFCSYPPEMVKEMPKKVLVKEFCFHAAIMFCAKLALISVGYAQYVE